MARITLPWAKLVRRRVVEARRVDGTAVDPALSIVTPDWTCRACGHKGLGEPKAECPACGAATVVVETGRPERART